MKDEGVFASCTKKSSKFRADKELYSFAHVSITIGDMFVLTAQTNPAFARAASTSVITSPGQSKSSFRQSNNT